MTEEVRKKVEKVYRLVNNGVQGEKDAAKAALDRLMKKYNLNDKDIESIAIKIYSFKYSNNMDLMLLGQLMNYFFKDKNIKAYKHTYGIREVRISLEYMDYVLLSSSYEYFRRHMKAQFKELCAKEINRRRSAKTKNKRRAELQDVFFRTYAIKSKIYHPEEVETIDLSELSEKELKDRLKVSGVKGGEFNTQVSTGLYLEN
jgi:hypothetical protein